MSDMAEYFRDLDAYHKERKARNLASHDPSLWAQHNEYHWYGELLGDKIDFWPSRNKWMWRGRIYTGDVYGFIKNHLREAHNWRVRPEFGDECCEKCGVMRGSESGEKCHGN